MLIYGINPYTIAKTRILSFRRRGRHPLYYRFRNRKHPILSIFWDGAPDEWDGIWHRPTVEIIGACGKPLASIECRSHIEAQRICKELDRQLEDFVRSHKIKE